MLRRDRAMTVERISIEVTQQCSKQCYFCYNSSHAGGVTTWTPDELVNFILDCARSGTRAVSLGGGEPLEYPGLFEVMERLQGVLFRSITSNGLHLKGEIFEQLIAVRPDKMHLSIHFPERDSEVRRVIEQVNALESHGIRSGVNLLVSATNLTAARQASQSLIDSGITRDRIIYLPQRKNNTPTPQQIANVADTNRFQSMTCLMACQSSPRFCSIAWDKTVAWCSYTVARRPLASLTAKALETALQGLPLTFCGEF